MKKLLLLLLTIFCLSCFSFTIVNAEEITDGGAETSETVAESTPDGEIADESGVIAEDEEITEESTLTDTEPKFEFTKEELTEIVNGVLDENQKETVGKVSELLAKWFNLPPELVYLIVAGGAVVLIVVGFFVVKYITKSGAVKQLEEQVSALSEILKEKEKESKLSSALDMLLSEDGLQALVKKGCEDFAKTITAKFDETKLSEKTISDLELKSDITTCLTQKVFDALKILLAETGNVGALNELNGAPETAVMERLEFENVKMRQFLGEEAVNSLLKS